MKVSPMSRHERGLLGARARWGSEQPRVVRLDALSDPQRALVLQLIEHMRPAKADEPPKAA